MKDDTSSNPPQMIADTELDDISGGPAMQSLSNFRGTDPINDPAVVDTGVDTEHPGFRNEHTRKQ